MPATAAPRSVRPEWLFEVAGLVQRLALAEHPSPDHVLARLPQPRRGASGRLSVRSLAGRTSRAGAVAPRTVPPSTCEAASASILNVAIILCAAGAATAWAWYAVRRAPQRAIDQSDERYTIGEHLPDIGVRFDAKDRSVVFFVMSTCQVCTDSMPFYRALRAERDRTGAAVSLIAVSFDSQRALESYLGANQFEPDSALTVPYSAFRLRRTPTLLLVDRTGEVLEVWQGRLSEERERDVLKTVTGSETAMSK